MESYKAFLERINSFEKPVMSMGEDYFNPSESVRRKVNLQNKFNSYFGDTVVFDLTDADKAKIAQIIQELYIEVPECFCERLSASTLHMTLHDLSSSDDFSQVEKLVEANGEKLFHILQDIPPHKQTITMHTNYILNMVNTSIVLALCPASEADYEKLMSLYMLVDKVRTLPYPLTPHITLAYYNYYGFSANVAKKLCAKVNELNKTSFNITLSTEKLFYQCFTSMNDYQKKMSIGDVH